MSGPEDLLEETERIAAVLEQRRIFCMVIGAAAMAAHGYIRHTEDIDLAINIAICDLASVADSLRTAGYVVAVREPDGQDPLGGVIDVSGSFGLVQIVNFGERFPFIIDSRCDESALRTHEGGSLRIAPLSHLIGLNFMRAGSSLKQTSSSCCVAIPRLIAKASARCAASIVCVGSSR